jgi:putative YhdH/YhfP family quinone oxidoreductase
MKSTFKALRIGESSEGTIERKIVTRSIDDLPPGELVVKVQYSSLNYKDALSATGNKGITRKYPHTPGIDAAGIVVQSLAPDFTNGDEVVITGYDLGMNTDGGFGQYIRIPATWALHKPEGFTLFECMAIGTAGITAGLALYKMECLGMSPSRGYIIVTGATGGVGSLAVAILSKAGYAVLAISGKEDAWDYLRSLGAQCMEQRTWVDDPSGKALLKPQWAGAIDTVGGNILSTLLKGCKPEGVVACTGLVASAQLSTTVYPFILNGVSLVGVGSAETPLYLKKKIWERLGTSWDIRDKLQIISRETTLEELNDHYIPAILQGGIKGRVVVSLL